MILHSILLAGLIFTGEKHDRDHHEEHKHRPPYNHEWVERQKIKENQEQIIQELRRQREDQRDHWRNRNLEGEKK